MLPVAGGKANLIPSAGCVGSTYPSGGVSAGSVLFCFMDDKEKSSTLNETHKIILSQEPYFRLTVPPGIWFGFKGISDGLNLICNIANIQHDPNEVIRKDIENINIDWSIE